MARPGPSVPRLRGQRAPRGHKGARRPQGRRGQKGAQGCHKGAFGVTSSAVQHPATAPKDGSGWPEQRRGPVGNKASGRKGRAEGQMDVDRQSESEGLGAERELKREPILKDRRTPAREWRPKSSVRQFDSLLLGVGLTETGYRVYWGAARSPDGGQRRAPTGASVLLRPAAVIARGRGRGRQHPGAHSRGRRGAWVQSIARTFPGPRLRGTRRGGWSSAGVRSAPPAARASPGCRHVRQTDVSPSGIGRAEPNGPRSRAGASFSFKVAFATEFEI